jgi:hypothetical protein
MFKRLGNILGWSLLGGLGAFATFSMYFTFLSILPWIMQVGTPPPLIMQWIGYGIMIGLPIGLWQAGFRVYLRG